MATQIYVNLPVKDLKRSVDFFTKMGYTFNQQFTDENATCMVVSEHIYVMLLVEKFFGTFTDKQIIDATKQVEVINAISLESRAAVDKMVESALAAGATMPKPAQDYGWMYYKSIQDLDGHIWEFVYTDPAGPPKA